MLVPIRTSVAHYELPKIPQTSILSHLRQPTTRPIFDTASSSNNTAKMATELTVQSERAFQKQPHIFLNSKTKAKSSKKADKTRRWYKEVGLGFRTPLTAIDYRPK